MVEAEKRVRKKNGDNRQSTEAGWAYLLRASVKVAVFTHKMAVHLVLSSVVIVESLFVKSKLNHSAQANSSSTDPRTHTPPGPRQRTAAAAVVTPHDLSGARGNSRPALAISWCLSGPAHRPASLNYLGGGARGRITASGITVLG